MDALTVGAIFIIVTVAYLIGKGLGYRKGWRLGYAEGWRRRERYGNGGRHQWWNRPQRIKGEPRRSGEPWDR